MKFIDTRESVPSLDFANKFCGRLGGYDGGYNRTSFRSLTGEVFIAEFNSFDSAKYASLLWGTLLPSVCRGSKLRRMGEGRYSISIPVVS